MVYLIVTVLFSLVVALFAMQNAIAVTVTLGVWRLESSLALVVIGSAAAGILAALPVWIMMQVKLRFRLMKANSRLKELESELAKNRDATGSVAKQTIQDKPQKPPEPEEVQ